MSVPISATSASARYAADPGDRVQPRDRLVTRAQPLGDLGAHPGDGRLQEVDVGQLLGDQEALVGA